MAKVKLGNVCKIMSGSTPKTKNEEFWDGDIDWITPAELNEDTYIITESKRKITQLGVDETGLKPLPKGTVILSSRAPIGKVAIAGKQLYCNQGFKNFICSQQIENTYLYWFLKSKNEYLNSLGRGATFKEISKNIVENIEIELPEINEQKLKAKKLRKCWCLISLKKAQLAKLDELVKSRFVEMFGDLTHGDKVTAKKHKIGELAEVTKLAGFEFTKYIKYQDAGEIIMLRGLNCKRGKLVLDNVKYIDRETSLKLSRSRLYKGDILMTYAGTVGDVAIVDEDDKYHLAPNVAKISIVQKALANPLFLVHLFMYSNDYIMTFASQVAQASINMQKIRDFEYFIPSKAEQDKFAAFVLATDKSKAVIQKSLDETQLLFDSLMQKYFG